MQPAHMSYSRSGIGVTHLGLPPQTVQPVPVGGVHEMPDTATGVVVTLAATRRVVIA